MKCLILEHDGNGRVTDEGWQIKEFEPNEMVTYSDETVLVVSLKSIPERILRAAVEEKGIKL